MEFVKWIVDDSDNNYHKVANSLLSKITASYHREGSEMKVICDNCGHRKNCMKRMMEHEFCAGWEPEIL